MLMVSMIQPRKFLRIFTLTSVGGWELERPVVEEVEVDVVVMAAGAAILQMHGKYMKI
jgi:hypothetical protein